MSFGDDHMTQAFFRRRGYLPDRRDPWITLGVHGAAGSRTKTASSCSPSIRCREKVSRLESCSS